MRNFCKAIRLIKEVRHIEHIVDAYRDRMGQRGRRRADMRPPRAMNEVSTAAGCGEGTSRRRDQPGDDRKRT